MFLHACFSGYLGPGGLSENAQHMNCTGGAARYIDHVILGDSHMYHYPTCRVLQLVVLNSLLVFII